MKKTFLSLALLLMPTLYASQNDQTIIEPIIISPATIVERDKLYILSNSIFLYNNEYNPKNMIYPNSLLSCNELAGDGTIYIGCGNSLVIKAKDISDFKGIFYRHLTASLVIYTETKWSDIKYKMYPLE